MQTTEFLNSGLTEYSILVIIKKLCAVIVDSEANISDERKVKYLHRLASYQIKGEEGKDIFTMLSCSYSYGYQISFVFCYRYGIWGYPDLVSYRKEDHLFSALSYP